MQQKDGWHSGDHSGAHHWKNMKIKNGGCGNCGPVFCWNKKNNPKKLSNIFRNNFLKRFIFFSTKKKADVIERKEKRFWKESIFATEIKCY